jgi:hypothetical protein
MTDKVQDTQQIDLVIIIDTSPSMRDEAVALSEATETAIEAVEANCPSDLRVLWFGIEGTWENSNFNQTIRNYLVKEVKVPESKLRGRKRGTVPRSGAQEDGARAIEDIADYFDWRTEATRAIFYLGDEALEGGGKEVDPEDTAAANLAIQKAKNNQVMVHTYFGTSASRYRQELQQEYARIAHETRGKTFTKENVTSSGFAEVLKQVICTTTIPCKSVDSVCLENAQEMEVCVCGPNGANRLFIYTGTAVFEFGGTWREFMGDNFVKGYLYFKVGRQFSSGQVLQVLATGALASISNGGPANNAGWAVDSVEAYWDEKSGQIELKAELGVRDTDGWVHRFGYQINVLTKISTP